MNCLLEVFEGDTKRCTRCDRRFTHRLPPEKIHLICKGKPGLGDYVAKGLAALGIKKKRGCGCAKRQAALNDIGKKLGI